MFDSLCLCAGFPGSVGRDSGPRAVGSRGTGTFGAGILEIPVKTHRDFEASGFKNIILFNKWTTGSRPGPRGPGGPQPLSSYVRILGGKGGPDSGDGDGGGWR